MHDSIAFYSAFEKFNNTIGFEETTYFAGDAAYITSHICKTLINKGLIPCLPYKRPMTKKGYFKKYEYTYDEHNDIYICPNEHDLIPTSINKDGYIIYKADKNDCSNCPFKDQCTKMKAKQITRHVWEGYKEMAQDYRYRQDVKDVYKQRSMHIERIYDDCKMKHGLSGCFPRMVCW